MTDDLLRIFLQRIKRKSEIMSKIWWKAYLQKLIDRIDSDSPFTDLLDVKEICSGGKWIFWILGFSDCFDHKVVSQRGINNNHFCWIWEPTLVTIYNLCLHVSRMGHLEMLLKLATLKNFENVIAKHSEHC